MSMEKRTFIRSKVKVEKLFEKLPPFDKVLLKSPLLGKSKIAMRKSDWQILSLVDGRKNIYQILADSPLSMLETLHSIQWLMNAGLLFEKDISIKLMESKVNRVNRLISLIKEKVDWKKMVKETISNFRVEEILKEAVEIGDEEIKINRDKIFLNARVIENFFIELYDNLFHEMERSLTEEEIKKIINVLKG